MKTSLMPSAYKKLTEEYAIDLDLTREQNDQYSNNQRFTLSSEQLENIVDQLTNVDGIETYIVDHVNDILPISISLFVLNDKLWKMMERKSWDTAKMLAMTTIPLCTWEQKEEKTSNPKAVKRWEVKPNSITLEIQKEPILKIHGEGGDFSGFIEQSHITTRKFGMMGSRDLVPNYVFERIHIEAEMNKASIEIHPSPRDDLDYDFSENARTYYEYGLSISAPGENVTLTVGKRKPSKMLGEVYLLVGKQINSEDDHYKALKTIIWLRAFQRRFGGR